MSHGRLHSGEGEGDEAMDDDVAEAQRQVASLAKSIRKKKGIIKEKARMARKNNHPTMSRAVAARQRSVGEFVEHMASMGVSTNAASLPNLSAKATHTSSADALPVRSRGARTAAFRVDTFQCFRGGLGWFHVVSAVVKGVLGGIWWDLIY